MAGAKLLVMLVLLLSLGAEVWGRELVESSGDYDKAPEVPAAIAVSPETYKLVQTVYAKGHQHYRFNGSSWVLFNATAKLYTPKRTKQLLGYHFFLPELDARGGRPTWQSGNFGAHFPFSSVTAKPMSSVVVDPKSITWVLLESTQAHGNKKYFGEVVRVQRYKTKGGLAPTSKRARVGATKKSAYTCLYSFYIAAKKQ